MVKCITTPKSAAPAAVRPPLLPSMFAAGGCGADYVLTEQLDMGRLNLNNFQYAPNGFNGYFRGYSTGQEV
ncbi:hypothetical protein EK21DRAFT_108676 [Setomelanomma holmii]|uniref:Uncharacterized protein n=1 Tax=Setomelanomma holmii TaxID=210430 RepID=A0A9P4LRM6_9PLEO|nr:hypothetical protein EK21DRAFT_108676 [Setomelanomma holmii]